jgi:hypothetical protein
MTGDELVAMVQDPEIRQRLKDALGVPDFSIVRALEDLAAAQARTDASVKELAAAQARTEASVRDLAAGQQELAAAQARTEASVKELAAGQQELSAAQARTEASVKELAAGQQELAAAQARTDASVKELAAAQARTDASVKELAAAQARTDASVKELAAAQARTDASVTDLRQAVGALSDNVGFGLEELAAIVLPAQLERDERTILTGSLQRKFVSTAAGEVEMDLWAPGERDGSVLTVVGEVKSRIYAADVKKFADRADRVAAAGETDLLPIMLGFVVHPSAKEVAATLGVRVIATR